MDIFTHGSKEQIIGSIFYWLLFLEEYKVREGSNYDFKGS